MKRVGHYVVRCFPLAVVAWCVYALALILSPQETRCRWGGLFPLGAEHAWEEFRFYDSGHWAARECVCCGELEERDWTRGRGREGGAP